MLLPHIRFHPPAFHLIVNNTIHRDLQICICVVHLGIVQKLLALLESTIKGLNCVASADMWSVGVCGGAHTGTCNHINIINPAKHHRQGTLRQLQRCLLFLSIF